MRLGKPPAGMPGGLNPGGTTSEAPNGRGCGCWDLEGPVSNLGLFPAQVPNASVGLDEEPFLLLCVGRLA